MLLLLSTAIGLTFFVTSFFALQANERLLSRMKASQLALLAHGASLRSSLAEQQRAAFEEQRDGLFLGEAIRASGAEGGCIGRGQGRALCQGLDPDSEARLRARLVTLPLSETKPLSFPQGLSWIGGIPGHRFLDLVLFLEAGQEKIPAVFRYSLLPLREDFLPVQRSAALYCGINLLMLLAAGFFRLRRRIIQPLEQLIRRTDAYTDVDGPSFLTLESGSSELGRLSVSMQRMTGRIRSDREKLRRNLAALEEANQRLLANQEEMIQAQKLSSVGRLAAGLAHEIGNPLSIIQGYLSLLGQRDLDDEERRDFLGRAERELERISRLIRRLLDFSRPAEGGNTEVDLRQVLYAVLDLLRPQIRLGGLEVHVSCAEGAFPVHANAGQLFQVFLNCLLNAVDALRDRGEGGAIEARMEAEEGKGGSFARVDILDNGSGFTGEALQNAFEPFFTTKEPGRGTGLGLSVSYALIKTMGGAMVLANRPEGGAAVSIRLPLVPVAAAKSESG